MARVTSKLQVTVPKAIALQYGIQPGDDLEWVPAGDAVRVCKAEASPKACAADLTARRLALFDAATERQSERQKVGQRKGTQRSRQRDRGWKRQDLYDRGVAR
jgi:bifunctional DNA-binding transcriptional regulator/antitoxin component of YhaV-PrlF toxin-antitoxin module